MTTEATKGYGRAGEGFQSQKTSTRREAETSQPCENSLNTEQDSQGPQTAKEIILCPEAQDLTKAERLKNLPRWGRRKEGVTCLTPVER
jgi:hypothetical protein